MRKQPIIKPYPVRRSEMFTIRDLRKELLPKGVYDPRWPHARSFMNVDVGTGIIEIDLRRMGEMFTEVWTKSDARGGKLKDFFWKKIAVPIRRLTWNWPLVRRRANIRSMQTELCAKVALMAITKEGSPTWTVADAQYRLLHGLITSRDHTQPVFIWDNFCHHDSLEYFLASVGRTKEAIDLANIWMDAVLSEKARDLPDKERKKYLNGVRRIFKKAHKDKLLSIVKIKLSKEVETNEEKLRKYRAPSKKSLRKSRRHAS